MCLILIPCSILRTRASCVVYLTIICFRFRCLLAFVAQERSGGSTVVSEEVWARKTTGTIR